MSNRTLRKGQLVKSRAGRDQDSNYLVYDWDNQFVYVVDGEYKRLKNPKKKNIRHLWYSNKVDEVINNKFENDEKITNKDIREALERLLQ